MSKILNFFKHAYISLIVLAVTLVVLFIPDSGLWVNPGWINYFLMVIMFCMGIIMKPSDFAEVFKHPKLVTVGCIAQYAVMPLLAFLIGTALQLDTALLVGLILVGTAPGGTASDVMTFLAKGDVALSVSVTAVNTLLAPVLTPAITFLYIGATVGVDVVSMFVSIVQVVVVPIVVGFGVQKLLGDKVDRISRFLPALSLIAICLILAAVVSSNSAKIFDAGLVVVTACFLLNVLGYAAGFAVAVVSGMKWPQRKAMSLEIGMQNSGLATVLASSVFPNLAIATVPGAIFSVIHNITGAILSSIFSHFDDEGRLDVEEGRGK